MVKTIVFDFDGTIADTHNVLVEITNRLSAEFGYKPIGESELLQLKNLSSREIVTQSEISPLKIPFLLKRVKQELGKEIQRLKPVPGIKEVLWQLKAKGFQLGIITSNSKENVIAFLENNQLRALFDFIYSGTTLFSKHRIIRIALKQYCLVPQEMVYVGDETRDIIAARKSGVCVVAVGWGFNSAVALAEQCPDFLIEHPQQLLDVVESWQPATRALL